MSEPIELPAPTPESDAELQRALADAIEAYAARVHEFGDVPPFPAGPRGPSERRGGRRGRHPQGGGGLPFEIAAMFNI